MKRIIFTVTTDLTYDQRMDRICSTLANEGFDILLVGREKKSSIPLKDKPYDQVRLRCRFEKGKFFYLEYSIRLFLFLLKQKTDILCTIDLDTILTCFAVAKIKNTPLVYDAHEYFTEVIEVAKRPFIKKVWLAIESYTVPKIKYAYTVSEGLRQLFEQKYKTRFELVRNVSLLESFEPLPKEDKYIIYAGAVNEGRGIEEFIEAMPYINCKLLICGEGDIYEEMVEKVKKLNLTDKVTFLGYVEPDKLKILTRKAYIGFLLLENESLSYYYSLANKFFDYMHAGIPQITINFPEYQIINSEYKVAELIELDVQQIIQTTNRLLNDQEYYNLLASNALKARNFYNWQNEALKLTTFYKNIG